MAEQIQRWEPERVGRRIWRAGMEGEPDGAWVSYRDHLTAMEKAREEERSRVIEETDQLVRALDMDDAEKHEIADWLKQELEAKRKENEWQPLNQPAQSAEDHSKEDRDPSATPSTAAPTATVRPPSNGNEDDSGRRCRCGHERSLHEKEETDWCCAVVGSAKGFAVHCPCEAYVPTTEDDGAVLGGEETAVKLDRDLIQRFIETDRFVPSEVEREMVKALRAALICDSEVAESRSFSTALELYEAACCVEEFLRKVTAWEGSAEDEQTEAIEAAEQLAGALESATTPPDGGLDITVVEQAIWKAWIDHADEAVVDDPEPDHWPEWLIAAALAVTHLVAATRHSSLPDRERRLEQSLRQVEEERDEGVEALAALFVEGFESDFPECKGIDAESSALAWIVDLAEAISRSDYAAVPSLLPCEGISEAADRLRETFSYWVERAAKPPHSSLVDEEGER